MITDSLRWQRGVGKHYIVFLLMLLHVGYCTKLSNKLIPVKSHIGKWTESNIWGYIMIFD